MCSFVSATSLHTKPGPSLPPFLPPSINFQYVGSSLCKASVVQGSFPTPASWPLRGTTKLEHIATGSRHASNLRHISSTSSEHPAPASTESSAPHLSTNHPSAKWTITCLQRVQNNSESLILRLLQLFSKRTSPPTPKQTGEYHMLDTVLHFKTIEDYKRSGDCKHFARGGAHWGACSDIHDKRLR